MPTEKIPDNADVYTKKQWTEAVLHGAFVPYDGTGHWATALYMDRKTDAFKPAPEWATHVAWFNK